jgi:hypothetical protein
MKDAEEANEYADDAMQKALTSGNPTLILECDAAVVAAEATLKEAQDALSAKIAPQRDLAE